MREGDGRARRRVVAAAVALVAVPGCSLLGGASAPSVEVVENAFAGDLELSDHEVEEDEIAGFEAVVVHGTATNTTDESIRAGIGARFYDADGRLVGRDGPAFTGTEIPPDEPHRYDRLVEGRFEDVDRIELRVVTPQL